MFTEYLILLFFSLMFSLPVVTSIDQHEIKLGIKYDLDAHTKFGDKDARLRIKRIIEMANKALANTRSGIVLVELKTVSFTDSLTGGDIYQDVKRASNSDYWPSEKVDLFQIWTAKSYKNGPILAAPGVICGPQAFSLISIVDDKGNILPNGAIAHLFLKGLTINMNMTDKTMGCKCSSGKCVTNSDSTGEGRNYLSFPYCAKQFMDKKFNESKCTHERNQGKTFFFGEAICGNGVLETSESCECRVGDVNCQQCCRLKDCSQTKAPGCVYPETQTTPHTDLTRGSTDPGTTNTTDPATGSKFPSTYIIPVVVAGVIGLFILIGLIGFVVYKKRQGRRMTMSTTSSSGSSKSGPTRKASLPEVLKNRALKFEVPANERERIRSGSPSGPTI
jgi:hypothetical protein